MKNDDKQFNNEPLFFINQNLSDNQLKKKSRYDWIEESYLDEDPSQSNKSNKNYIGLVLSSSRLNAFFIILLIFLSILLIRCAYLQIYKGAEYFQLAENNRIRIHYIKSPRGIVYDRNGVPLVKNVPKFSLYLTPVDFPKNKLDQDKIIELLKKYFGENFDARLQEILTIKNNRKEYFQPQTLISGIDYEKSLMFMIVSQDLPGLEISLEHQREYLTMQDTLENPFYYNSLSHLLGYVGKVNTTEYEQLEPSGYLYNDVVGKTGLEKFYEEILRGEFGKKQVEVDSFGNEIKILAMQDEIKGKNIELTIDLKMQTKLETILREEMIKAGKSKAVGIVEDPNNGEILAMVSLPSYNNNWFASNINEEQYSALLNDETLPLFNRAITGEYPSGSSIKPVFAAAALQEGIISAKTSFLSVGGIRVGEWFFPDWRAGGHGITNVRKALSDSVNTFFYIIGGGYQDFKGLGVYLLNEYGQKFGLMNKTNIDLPSEKSGFLPTPEWKQEVKNEQWYIGDTYHMAIGQGDVLVTPIQVANYTSFFANSGTLYQPHLLKTVINPQNDQKTEFLPEIINSNFIDKDNIQIVREGLRETITVGSGRSLNSLPITVAGKTGTAQWGTDKDPHAWFTGFAPYDKPQIVITILIEEGEEGSVISTEIAKKFLYWYAINYN